MSKAILLALMLITVLLVSACTSDSDPNEFIGGGSNVDDYTEETAAGTVVVDLVARQWEFTPREIRVNLGDKVELHIESVDVTHGFLLPEFGVNLRLTPGNDVHAEFTADKKGEFSFYCNVPCGRGHSGMVGLFIVE